jgi:S1-C subfamily serine protease
MTPAAYLKEVLDDLGKQSDPNNVPLREEEESHLAWLGAELQPLNRELARANNVSDLTHDGESGALVAYVYPDSPASQAGIEPGYILLRLYVEGQPKPLEVKLESDRGFTGSFPWDRLDEVPEQFYERLPRPWPPAENEFTRSLTDLGFGKAYAAEFFQNGKVLRKELQIVESPPHYDTAARYESKGLGLTVRDLTYEVRRYFQRSAADPGVIVSKVEPGSKASVSGIKPYEIVTHVDDVPIQSVKEFETLIQDKEELRLSVLRMTLERQVRVKVEAAGGKKEPGQTRE